MLRVRVRVCVCVCVLCVNQLLESRGCLVIRQLSLHINPEKIYRALASILQDQQVRFRNPGTPRLALPAHRVCPYNHTFLCTGPRVRVRDDSNAQRHPPHLYRALRS